MRLILSEAFEPAFHLAWEETLLNEQREEFCILYRNLPCVVIGRHQNAFAEVNQEYLEKWSIPLYRRISGGGTVYHDPGNVNFCFLRNLESSLDLDYGWGLDHLAGCLQEMGYPVERAYRSDLFLREHKISGNALRMHRKRSLHHGTLLFDADLQKLRLALKTNPGQFQSRAIASIPRPVVNLSEACLQKGETEAFMKELGHRLASRLDLQPGSWPAGLQEKAENRQLVYQGKWDWNWASGPAFSFLKSSPTPWGNRTVRLKVEKGKFSAIEWLDSADKAVKDPMNAVLERFPGKPYTWPGIRETLESFDFYNDLPEVGRTQLLRAFFTP